MDADRNLLFGALALEERLIDAHQFAEACTLWAQRQDRSLAELLVEKGWIAPAARARLETLVDIQDPRAREESQIFLKTAAIDYRALRDKRETSEASAKVSVALDWGPPAQDTPLPSRYTMNRLYAEGGIGRIWLAHDTQLHREVALKTLRAELSGHARVRSRFLQEAQITGQLEHPGIVPVYELVPHSQADQSFYAMRFVRGQTLVDASRQFHLQRKKGTADPLSLVSLLTAFVAVCNTVAYAHSRGVVHRDLKGENVLLGDFGEVILLDWGVAKVLGSGEIEGGGPATDWNDVEPDQTVEGDVIGTPAYMAPEQAEGKIELIDALSDIYGLGAVLYEILAGRPPFVGSSTVDVLAKVLREEPTLPCFFWPEVPTSLQAICLKALSKERACRYSSATDLAHDVQTWQEKQRRQAEEALRRQSEILQSILDNMGESLIVADEHGRLLLFNPEAERLLGAHVTDATLDEAIRRCPMFLADRTTLCPADELPLQRALRGEVVDDAELFIMSTGAQNGRWLSANARPIRDAAGELRGALMVLRDVTDRRETEEELRRSRERFELAVQGSQDGLWDWDLKTNEVFYSPRWKSILGYRDDEIKHRLDEWETRLHPDEKEKVLAANYAHINGTTPHYEYEYRLRHKDGSFRWILARGVALKDANGVAYRMAGSHVDVTDWRRLDSELHASEERYRAVIKATTSGLIVVNADGLIRDCNREAGQMLELPVDEVVGKDWNQLLARFERGDDAELEAKEATAAAPQQYIGLHRENGSVRWLLATTYEIGSPGSEAAGKIVSLVEAPVVSSQRGATVL